MIYKKDISRVSGLNPEYIQVLGEAIAKAGARDPIDFSYVLEKTGKIEDFIKDVSKDCENYRKGVLKI